MKTPREIIAYWLWTELDQIDLDDKGDQAAQDILQRLNNAGYKVVPHRTEPESQ